MNYRLGEYKRFIDALVRLRHCSLVKWVKQIGWPKLPQNEKCNKFLSELTTEQKGVLAEIIQDARNGGIHDILAYLNEEITKGGLHISRNDIELAIEPYGTELYYDWVCRCEGDDWPEGQLKEEYR